jgi:nickel-type superoxide dismutase maturation protease
VHWPIWRVKVAERSMEPALRPGDWLLVRRTRRIRPGQIVLARHPGRPEMLIVKRAARRVDGGWWLESDNPGAGAVDSGRFGVVAGDLIEGRVLGRYRRARSLSRTGRVSRPAHTERPRLPTGPFLVCRDLSGGCRCRAVRALRPAC